MPVLRVALVCVQCLAIAGCAWAIGLTMGRYGAEGRRAWGQRGVPVLAAAIVVNAAILAAVSLGPP